MSKDRKDETAGYPGPSGGWGSLKGVAKILKGGRPDAGVVDTLMRQNKAGGHMCTSCAWTKPASPHPFEFCENGAKATIWDLTRDRCGPDFLESRTLTELRGWSDHDLEKVGRLTHPMRYDAGGDRYLRCTWEEAFEGIGAELRALDPKSVAFYASGRASLETSYLFALFARLYGNNNLADSSNMCHETTSVGLKKVIGASVGTCVLEDFEHCDMILFFGQNTGTNSPRFLHPLQAASKRGCDIVSFNPLREKGLLSFRNPQSPREMLTGADTDISRTYLQVRPGGDIAALTGMCKRLFELDDRDGGVIDRAFVEAHTDGFAEFEARMRGAAWEEVERISGLAREALEDIADRYAKAQRVIGIYGMGLTQHVHGWLNIAMLTNLLLMRGNVGKKGAGISPVRGHSNVQGQRTVGISEKPELIPVEQLEERFGFEVPKEEGMNTVEVAEGLLEGRVKGFVSLGGNFARAIPDQGRTDGAWQGLELNVQIATKLNRSHLLPGRATWLLPCLVRAEEDMQATGPQAVSMEDSLSCIHGSQGRRKPASPELKSEIAIVAGIAKATLPPNPKVTWDAWTGDYALVRDLIEASYPDKFRDFNRRLFTPGGFHRGNPAREREWRTDTGRAHFIAPHTLCALGKPPEEGELTLVTVRSNDQFNTTIYGYDDRLRGIRDRRDVLMISPREMERRGLRADQVVTVESTVEDGVERVSPPLRVTPYDLPDGCVTAYYPEINAVIPLHYHEELSKTPAYKGVPVRIRA